VRVKIFFVFAEKATTVFVHEKSLKGSGCLSLRLSLFPFFPLGENSCPPNWFTGPEGFFPSMEEALTIERPNNQRLLYPYLLFLLSLSLSLSLSLPKYLPGWLKQWLPPLLLNFAQPDSKARPEIKGSFVSASLSFSLRWNFRREIWARCLP